MPSFHSIRAPQGGKHKNMKTKKHKNMRKFSPAEHYFDF